MAKFGIFSVMGYRDGEPWLVASKPSALVYLHARFNWLHVYGGGVGVDGAERHSLISHLQ